MAEIATLELPTHKGRAGWEFTELGDFTLEAWEPAPAGGIEFTSAHLLEPPAGAIELVQVDGASGDGAVSDAGLIVLPLSVARERHPELVEPHLGTIVRDVDAFTAVNERDWEGGAFVHVPKDVVVEAPILLTAVGTRRGQHPQPARADRARGGRRGRGVGAVPVRRRGRDRAQHRRRAEGRAEREAALRLRAGAQREVLDLRLPARRGGARRRARLGRARLRLRQGQGADGDAAGRPGRRRQGHRRLRAARAPARRLRHDAGARRAEHDVRPRVPRHPRRPLDARSGAG